MLIQPNFKIKTIKTVLCLAAALAAIGCGRDKAPSSDRVNVEFNNSITPLSKVAKSVYLLALESDEEHLVGSMADMIVTEDSYVIIDGQNGNIFRYTLDGRFANRIGRRGNGPEEYVHINDVQYKDSSLYVFSVPSKILRYSMDGTILKTQTVDNPELGVMSWLTSEGVLTYYGYGSGREGRFALLSGESNKIFYPSDEKVMNMTPATQIFTASGDSVFVVDSYSDVIKVYSAGMMYDGQSFDFGNYAIPDSFYKQDDPFIAMDALLGSEFATINRYLCDKDKRLLQVNVQKGMDLISYCGLYSDGGWIWFGTGKPESDILAGSFCQIKDNVLYCLLDPSLTSSYPTSLRRLTMNPEVLDSTSEDDNYIVAKIRLE